MAALALQQTRILSLSSRSTFLRHFLASSFIPILSASPRPLSWSIPPLRSLWELFPSVVLAVPKKKVSHSRKAMRAANKGLKDKENIVNCPGCGSAKLAHHLCPNCYSFLSRMWKNAKRRMIPDLS